MNRGTYITFEGGEGIGKTTQVRKLSDALTKKGVEFLLVREPGSTVIAEKIRHIILGIEKTEDLLSTTEVLLFAAARAQLFGTYIKPHLDKGGLVISDRGLDSSLAYQAYGRGLDFNKILSISQFALEDRLPDLTIFLDMDPVPAFERKGGADMDDRMEQSGIDFHKSVWEGFRNMAGKFPGRYVTVNAEREIDEIHNDIKKIMTERVLNGLEF